MIALVVVVILSYLVGSIPSSVWVGKLARGIDIRDYGSGNAGATNTFRILGWRCGVTVLFIDMVKGFLSAYWISQLAYHIGSGPISIIPFWEVDSFLRIACGVFAIIGHMFPFLANFDGGKGMATAFGMLWAIEPVSIAITAVIFLIVMFASRYVSLASLVAAFIYPLLLLLFRYGLGMNIDGSILLFGGALGIAIIVKHKGNIRRLLSGNENKVSSFKPAKGWLNKEKAKEL